MLAVTFIAAVVIGLALSVKYWRMWTAAKERGVLVEKDRTLDANDIIATKEYFLANRIIKY